MNQQETKNILIDNILSGKQTVAPEVKDELILKLRNDKTDMPIIYVGAGTCGLGAGAGATLKEVRKYLEEKQIEANVIETGCIGLCSSEPIVDIQLPGHNRVSFEKISGEKVNGLFDKVFALEIPEEDVIGQFKSVGARDWDDTPFIDEHLFFKPQHRVVLKNCGIVDPTSIEEYIARGGYVNFLKVLETKEPAEVCEDIVKSGLRGRGGGGFPTGMKWQFALKEEADQKYLICNADEGDPGAFMDRAVIEGDPHRLIEGMATAAYAIGASKAYIYIRAEYPLAISRLKEAISHAYDFGLLGNEIFGHSFNFDLVIKKGAGAFVCGEETALIHSIEGKRGMPRPRPPFPASKGLFGKPTIINNVETLSNIPGILEMGVENFAAVGTEKSKGTKVFALSGKIHLTGLVEIPMGTTIRDIIFKIGGGVKDGNAFKSVQIGGPSGGCITEQNLDIQIDYESLLEVGAMMGSGGLVVMDEHTCMVDVAKFFMDFIQRESCGKCIPCREGTRRMLEILESITNKPGNGNADALERFKGVMQLEKLGKVIRETSLCGLGQSAPNPVLSTLRWFRDEYEAHVFERKCPAGACTSLRVFKIDVDKCSGCTVCTKKCPTNAIIGSRKSPHFIVEDKCIGCGTCAEVCKFDAIEIV